MISVATVNMVFIHQFDRFFTRYPVQNFTTISDSVRSLVQNSCSDHPLHPSQSVAQPPGQAPVVAASQKELQELEILYGVLSAPTPRQGALEHKLPGQMPRMYLHSCPSYIWRLQKRLSVSMDERRLPKICLTAAKGNYHPSALYRIQRS